MQIIEQGNGDPLVLIPGLQGRWEYMSATVDALAGHCHVLTFSLCDEPSAETPWKSDQGLSNYVTQVQSVLDERGIARAAICGASFGGLVALRAAARLPDRVSALVLASTPG